LRARDRLVLLAGGLCLIVAALFMAADPGQTVRNLREAAFDRLLAWSPRAADTGEVVIVDIDRDALAAVGPWPWPRERMAELVERIAEAKPKVLAIDILLAGQGVAGSDAAMKRLSEAMARVPTVLALVLDPAPTADTPPTPAIAVSGDVRVPGLLVAAGVMTPASELAANAQGFGVISLPSPEGEPVRAVPLLAGGSETLFAGLAVEAVRVAAGGSALIAAAPPQVLRIGEHSVPLAEDGLMRLHFAGERQRHEHVVPAAGLLQGGGNAAKLAAKIVLLGASAPEAGGLRRTAVSGFTPSIEIQAEAVEQILTRHVPWRAAGMRWAEIAVAAVLGAFGIIAVIAWPPGRAAMAIALLLLAWIVAAALLSAEALWLTDPLGPAIAALFAAQGAGLTQFGLTFRQRLLIERRFAHHLPAAVVRRIAENPHELRVAGEMRTITVLSTDIEGFTAMTERLDPEALVALLDRYIDLVVGIVVEHGGMVDKLIGDAVHAYFNAPLDLPDHAEKAVTCAMAIVAETEALRKEPQAAAAGLGRTRIGIETGPAILGEVGHGSKRDYTAYGRAVNLASRLEQTNKSFGSAIALGPGTVASLQGKIRLRALGRMPIRGIEGEVEIFEPEM
jgi:adenylate cyclase